MSKKSNWSFSRPTINFKEPSGTSDNVVSSSNAAGSQIPAADFGSLFKTLDDAVLKNYTISYATDPLATLNRLHGTATSKVS